MQEAARTAPSGGPAFELAAAPVSRHAYTQRAAILLARACAGLLVDARNQHPSTAANLQTLRQALLPPIGSAIGSTWLHQQKWTQFSNSLRVRQKPLGLFHVLVTRLVREHERQQLSNLNSPQ